MGLDGEREHMKDEGKGQALRESLCWKQGQSRGVKSDCCWVRGGQTMFLHAGLTGHLMHALVESDALEQRSAVFSHDVLFFLLITVL